MDSIINDFIPAVQTVWQTLTNCALHAWTTPLDNTPPLGAPAVLLPHLAAIAPGETKSLTIENESWLVSRSQKAAPPFYLASAVPTAAVSGLMELLTNLLDQLSEERTASQQLTDEVILAWNRLNSTFELAKAVGRHTQIQPIVETMAITLRGVVSADDVWISLEENQEMRIYNASGQAISGLRQMLEEMPVSPLEITCYARGQTLPASIAAENPIIKNLVFVPLALDEQSKPFLGLLNHPTGNLNSGEIKLLNGMADQLNAILNAVLVRAQQQAAERLIYELGIAAQLQSSMLPREMPTVPGLAFAASLKPAFRVGGDLYDVQPLQDGFAVMVSDVAGKGISAAMVSALLHATFKSVAGYQAQPAQLMQAVNRLMYDELDQADTFVTAFLAAVKTDPLRLAYSSAGHTTTLLWNQKEKRVMPLTSMNFPLGLEPEMEPHQVNVPFAPGDVLLLYSDGITEAENSTGKVLGFEGLTDLLIACHQASAEDLRDIILKAVDIHRVDVPFRDDMALLIVKALPEPADTIPARYIPFVYNAEPKAARSLARLVRQEAKEVIHLNTEEATSKYLDDLELAVSEIATNIVLHAYQNYSGRIQGLVTIDQKRVLIDLIDSGIQFSASQTAPPFSPENPPAGGYGLDLARKLLDVCHYTRLPTWRNHWKLVKIWNTK